MINSGYITSQNKKESLFGAVDPIAILLYLVICITGCICITSASFDEFSPDIFSYSHFYIKQIIWFGIALVAALFVLLLDTNIFHKFAYPLYIIGVVTLIATLLFGREVNGAKSWFELGSFRLQPVEMVKISTALALARVMSEYSFSIDKIQGLVRVAMVVALPLGIIILQNDTGSGIVFCSFLFVLYREGLNKWLCIPVIIVAVLFICSFIFTSISLLIASILLCVCFDAVMTREYKNHIIYLALLSLATIVVGALSWLLLGSVPDIYIVLLSLSIVTTPLIIIHALRNGLVQRAITTLFFIFTTIFLPLCSYIFNSVLRPHQQNRIMSFLGMVSDPLGTDYNVNQSKIAIGSGGLFGKGFLEGTQIQYGFVPERHTDFIFCDLSEEWGFVGAFILLSSFMLLILKLLSMGERQKSSFGRIYCYAVASILLFHIFVNVGMTIGLMPVMGIPLPFMSYGGSSLVAFTVMLFIAFRFDAA